MVAPQLPATLLSPQSAHKDPIRVPSHFADNRDVTNLQKLLDLEADLRIAHGHDWIERVKTQLGVRSFATRHARQSHGENKNTRAQAVVRRAELKVNQAAAIYNRNWERLQALQLPTQRLRGLQPLKASELKILGTWLEDEMYRQGDSILPWFWSLHPLPNPDPNTPRDAALQAQVEAWNRESELAPVIHMVLAPSSHLPQSFV